MKGLAMLSGWALLLCLGIVLSGCREGGRRDTVLASVPNASRSLRATILQRQFFVEGREDTSPITYVLLDRDGGKPDYENGQDFRPSQIVIAPAQCGPLSLSWTEDHSLKIRCERCGLALSALGEHPRVMGLDGGSVSVAYEGFPETSSWETAPRQRMARAGWIGLENGMPEYLFLMHEDTAETASGDAWGAYLGRLRQSGCFEGGSAIGAGFCLRKSGDAPGITGHLSGYIPVTARDLEHVQTLVAGNPVYEAGGTVEIRELPRTD